MENHNLTPEIKPSINPTASGEKSNASSEIPTHLPEKLGVAPQETIGSKEASSQDHTMPLPTVTPLATAPVGVQPHQVVQGGTAGDNGVGPMIADDVDLIEKEWVEKAKSIVDGTRDDPHIQEKEVSKLQADYLKKRFGKEVKVNKA